jgi:hypothetical protein
LGISSLQSQCTDDLQKINIPAYPVCRWLLHKDKKTARIKDHNFIFFSLNWWLGSRIDEEDEHV